MIHVRIRHLAASLALALLGAACSNASAPGAHADDHVGSEASALSAAQCNYFAVNGTVRICHKTGSAKNPYTILNLSESACVNAHTLHAGDYVASNDPTCGGGGYLPAGAPCDGTLACQAGHACKAGTCAPLCEGIVCNPTSACDFAYCEPSTGQCVHEATTGNSCNDGSACTTSDVCQAGACVGANPVVCGACEEADSCNPSTGACAPKAAGTVCRAASGACDVAEACSGAGGECPADEKVAQGTECRAAGGACDVAEVCDGASDACPQDTFLAAGTACRASAGACDAAETCTGSAAACPADAKVTGVCRPAAGECDEAEACDGATNDCPADLPKADGASCNDGDLCTQTDTCQAGTCAGSNPVVCSADQCHLAGTCNPSTGACSAPTTAADGTSCDDGYVCSASDSCLAGTCSGGRGLASSWRAENNMLDSVGSNNGRAVGTVSYTAGAYGRAFALSSGSYVNVGPNAGNFAADSDFTIEYWFKTTSFSQQNMVSKRAACGAESPGWWDSRQSPNGVNFEYYDGVGYVGMGSSRSGMNNGLWHHVAITRSGTLYSIYIDGTLAQSSTGGTGGVSNTKDVKIGSGPCVNQDTTRVFNGALDEVSFYNRALTASEVAAQSAGVCAGVPNARTVVSTTTLYKTSLERADCQPVSTSLPSQGFVRVSGPATGSGNYTVHFETVGGLPNTLYQPAITCATFLYPAYRTDANGNGSADYVVGGTAGQTKWAFDTQAIDANGNLWMGQSAASNSVTLGQ